MPAYVVIGRPTSGASPSFTVFRMIALKTWWSPTTRSSSSMSRARFVRASKNVGSRPRIFSRRLSFSRIVLMTLTRLVRPFIA